MGNLILKNKILTLKEQFHQLKASILLVTAMGFSNSVIAIDIAQSPLFIDHSATPNIMFVLDDSGSMDWEILAIPHWRAQNYDHDIMRYWARGGWLGYRETPTSKVEDATWFSYTGYCNDRNADGVCFNELYLNNDGDRNDDEDSFIAPVVAPDDWRLRLNHHYFWEFPYGYCQMPSAPGGGGANAIDWLPGAGDVFAFLTQSKNIFAHTGHFGPSSSPYQWSGANHPSNLDTGGAGVYDSESWSNSGPDLNTWSINNAYQNNADQKTVCEANGGTWNRNTSNSKRILHHGPHAHKSGWVDGWTGAPTVNPLTGAITANGPLNSRTGDYHTEYLQNYTTATSGRARFDINGDGDGNDTAFKEKDYVTSNRVVNYRYIQHLTDNTYSRSDWYACGQTSTTQYYTAVNKCNRPNDYMPGNYPVSASAPIDNPSNKVASSQNNPGKMDFVQLSNPAVVPRYIRSLDWVGTPRTPNVDVLMPPWAAGTKHAMSKHDPMPLVVDWRARSADFNVMYYSPSSKYSVWPDITEVLPGGCSNKFNCARSNPQSGTAGYSLTTDLARPRSEYGAEGAAPVNVQAGFVYELWVDDAGTLPSRTRPEWKRGDASCGTTGGYTLSSGDITASYNGAGIVDPATGSTYAAGEHVCFSYLNLNPDGSAGDGVVDLWDSHYRVEVKDSEIVIQKVRRTPHLKGESLYNATSPGGGPPVYIDGSHYYWTAPANYASQKVAMSDTRVLSTMTYDPANYASYSTDALCLELLGEDPANPGHCRTLDQVKENAANWYQYSRKRSFVAKGAIANLMAEIPDVNYGLMGTKKDNSDNISILFKDVFDGSGSGNGNADRTVHNDNIRSSLYSYTWPATGTPLRLALERAGEYFAGRGPNLGPGVNNHSVSPITESCQKNYAIMLTDGYWNGTDPLGVTNEDGDIYSGVLADVAKKYYDEDLRPLLTDEVPTDAFDTNNKQHLTTIGIGFGVSGSLVDDPDPSDSIPADGWPGNPDASGAPILTESSTWGGDPDSNAAANQRYKIDDLWHAAYNSRGKYYKADNPEELILQLKAAILTALAAAGSASALTANSTVLTGTTRVYQTLFTSDEWSGEIKSYGLTASGLILPAPIWTAQSQLDALTPSGRKIFTLDASGAGVAFSWASLSPSQQIMLRTRWSPNMLENIAFGQAQLDYIRGKADAQFRSRAHKLGDIVHSEPLYVGAPSQLYPDSWHVADYSAFRGANSGRDPMLYVGANDGMMHAFDAVTGVEKYAYIPRVLLPELNALSHKPTPGQDFNHHYYVDDTPVSGDVFFAGAWHTVLVGGLGGGGKGIYALDITDGPSGAAEATIATNRALWEFTTANDVDMGYSFSRPSIVKLKNGAWGAVFGNGYNSANHKAVLYIVDVEDGSIIKKFEMGVGDASNSNGLSTPTVADTDGDMIADRIYAGDLLGNVWSVDISDVSVAGWKFSYDTLAVSNTAVAKTPLFTASDGAGGRQPITAPITLSQHPYGPLAGYILNFGTGKYLGSTDNTSTGQVTQSMYGIWDYGEAGTVRADLLQQIIESDLTHAASGTEVRATSANGPVHWINAGHNVGDVGWELQVDQKGWQMDLIDTGAATPANLGERIVSKMQIINGAILFSTLLPAADPCDGGGSGYTMTVNAATGSRFAVSPFDVSGDSLYSTADFVDLNGDGTAEAAISGVKSSSGIPSAPLMLYKPGGGIVAVSDHSSGGLAFSGAAGAVTCTVVGAGTCTVVPPVNPGDPSTCTTSDPTSTCYTTDPESVSACPSGSCSLFGIQDIGRQSWIQIE
jgi:type IV pilus assembly protein PilY1